MDKNAIKKYAVWARRDLIERVSQRAMIYGITAKDTGDPNAESVNGHLLSQKEKRQRKALISNIKTKGYEQVMEEVAYTWFNRFAALRFMEVNCYLPSHIRVFTNDEGEFKPQILAEAIHLELDGLDMNKVYELESANKSEDLFKYLLIVQCNALNSILPGMFQKIDDYTELLLPDYLLREGSVIEQMVTTIPEEDWTDQVQIIGWLYQYYNTEPKDKVFADQKKGIKTTKEGIPAATQLFTPDWIVRFMAENSLGRLWQESHPDEALKTEWKYYLDDVEQTSEVKATIASIQQKNGILKPEDIRIIDPSMGSGHILCVVFDMLVRIYESYGFAAREAAVKIIENNLWGLDIDDRAAQLSYFAVMMKARQYDRRFFARNVQPHVYAIEESNGITSTPMHDMGLNLTQEEYSEAAKQALRLVEEMHDAKEYGSIIHVTACDWDLLRRFAVPREEEGQLHLDLHGEIEASDRLQSLVNIGEALAQKYDVVITNPPYMVSGNMPAPLSEYTKKKYPNSKNDMFSVFIERGFSFTKPYGFEAMITMESWMFLSGFEKMRTQINSSKTICSLVHMPYLGKGGTSLGINFGTDMAVIRNCHIKGYVGTYDRIAYYETDSEGVPLSFPVKNEFFKRKSQDEFSAIPGAPVAYWVSSQMIKAFVEGKSYTDLGQYTKGIITGNNDRYLRFWWEIEFNRIKFDATSDDDAFKSGMKWFPCTKGGPYRKWYGNKEYIIDWEDRGHRVIYDAKAEHRHSQDYYNHLKFKPGITWSGITSASTSFRYECNHLVEHIGMCIFPYDEKMLLPLLGFSNSIVAEKYLTFLSPTVAINAGEIGRLPIRSMDDATFEKISGLVNANIQNSKADWDAFEASWDFECHPLVRELTRISEAYDQWCTECNARFSLIRQNEIELNQVFIDLYDLQHELNAEIPDNSITIRRADKQRDIRSLISFAVGCMLGRYSLDLPKLAFAGGEWDSTKYKMFRPDKDAIIPICDDEYFEDDIVGRFVKFVEVVYGRDTLEENLRFIADALGGKGSSREVIRDYFINDFYADHLKVYQKRPIYWLFDSGKKNGFKCLIYMHRYQPDTIARIRTDYVHEQQSRYRTAIADLEQRINGASTSERVKLSKQLATLQAQADEIRVYEEKIHHLADQMIKIDLDDGVKHNYEIFKDVLAKIK